MVKILNQDLFDALVSQAQAQTFSGWDFSFMGDRWQTEPLPWDYTARARQAAHNAASLLDMGTGGGEVLSSLCPFPAVAFATESYPPNVPVAARRLAPLGAQVVQAGCDDSLPFAGGSFDLILNRHESVDAGEVFRLLKKGGVLITQQVGGRDNFQLNELIQDHPHLDYYDWTPTCLAAQLEQAGLQVVDQREAFPVTTVKDIGVVVAYLRIIPWQIDDFIVERYLHRLAAIHNQIQEEGALRLKSHRFYIEAVRA